MVIFDGVDGEVREKFLRDRADRFKQDYGIQRPVDEVSWNRNRLGVGK